jgi:hypothetical protein
VGQSPLRRLPHLSLAYCLLRSPGEQENEPWWPISGLILFVMEFLGFRRDNGLFLSIIFVKAGIVDYLCDGYIKTTTK